MRRLFVCAFVAFAFFGLATRAQATTCVLSANTCTTPDGLAFTLTNLGVVTPDLNFATDSTLDTYKFQLDVNYDNYSGADTDFLNAVALKVTSNFDTSSFSTSATGTWASHPNTGLNTGCGGGGNGYVCADNSGTKAALGGTGTYTFFFFFDLGAGKSIDSDSVKAEWLDTAGGQKGQLSVDIPPGGFGTPKGGGDDTPVPEPTSLVLLGTGLMGAATAVARRRRRG